MAEYKGAAKEGARAMALIKKREKMKEDMEALKKKISEVGANYPLPRPNLNNYCEWLRTLACVDVSIIPMLSIKFVVSWALCQDISQSANV